MSSGWVKLHRRILDSSLWRNPNAARVFTWLLLKARHAEGREPFNGTDITLGAGTIVYGRKSALAQLEDLTEQKLRTALEYLKATSRITIQSNNKFSIITICNWESYQANNQPDNQPVTNQQPASNQQITTNKNVKKEKNVKNVEEVKSPLVEYGKILRMESCEMDELAKDFGVATVQHELKNADVWLDKADGSKAKKYRRPEYNHYLFFRGWLNRSAKRSGFTKPKTRGEEVNDALFEFLGEGND